MLKFTKKIYFILLGILFISCINVDASISSYTYFNFEGNNYLRFYNQFRRITTDYSTKLNYYTSYGSNFSRSVTYEEKDFTINLSSGSSNSYLSSIDLYFTSTISHPNVSSLESCKQKYEDILMNLNIHTLWSFYMDYDYDIEKFEPTEWLSVMSSYNYLFHEYSINEKILKKDDKYYREIVFSVTFLPYFYTYDGENYEFFYDDFKNGITYDSSNLCSAPFHFQFDFDKLPKFHQVNLGPIPQNTKSYLQLSNIKITDDSEDYFKLTDYERPDKFKDFEEVEKFPNKQTKENLIKSFLDTCVEDFKNSISLFFNKLTLAFTALFVPDMDDLEALFTRVKTEAINQFGFLLTPIDLFKTIINRFNNLSSTNMVINIPEIKVPNFDFVLIPATSFSFSDLLYNNATMNRLWTLYLDFIDVYLILAFLNLAWNKLNSVIGGMIIDNEYISVNDTEQDIDTYDNVTGAFKGSHKNIIKTTSKSSRRKIK